MRTFASGATNGYYVEDAKCVGISPRIVAVYEIGSSRRVGSVQIMALADTLHLARLLSVGKKSL